MIKEKSTDRLDKGRILADLRSSMFSRNLILREKMDSTNLFAKDLARHGAPEGTLVLAEEQTAGRGRQERRWLSPAYVNLLFSILVRPSLPMDRAFVLTMILAIAVIDSVKALYGLDTLIKWPNDLYIGNRKLGGILTEFSAGEGGIDYVVLGLGLNVNWNPGEEGGLLHPATSIRAESGAPVSRNELLVAILKRFEYDYGRLSPAEMGELYRRWNDLSMIMGREVDIHSREEHIRGTVRRIDPTGALIIQDAGGEERKILSGDVSRWSGWDQA